MHAQLKALLENQIIYISECGTNAFEQEVDGLDGHHITLLRIISTGAQRQTQMQLYTHTNTHRLNINNYMTCLIQLPIKEIYQSFLIIKSFICW